MTKRYIKALIEKATDGGYSFIASTSAVDRQGDSIDQTGWDIANFMKNPVMLWAHDYKSLPVAKVLTINPGDTRGTVGTYEFAPAEGNPFAAQLKVLVDEGFVNAVSVGFIPMERNGNIITKSELLEISFVPVPANQEALLLAAKSLEAKGFSTEIAEKAVAQFLTTKEETAEDKGAVSDELDAEEQIEMKWAALDPVFDIFNAFLDVCLDGQTPATSMPQLLLEVASLLTEYANNLSNEDEDQNEAQTAALRTLIRKTIGGAKGKEFLAKVGARHSADTVTKLQEAKDAIDSASTMIGAMLDASASTDDGGKADDEPKSAEVVEARAGVSEARVLLEARGVLRKRVGNDQHVLEIIGRTLAARA